MNTLQLVWKNITQQLGATLLSVLLTAFGVAILVVIYISSDTFQKQLDNNSKNIDLVVGAKGSPLQLILSSVYHVDYPTGNILQSEADKIANNPLVRKAVPISLGDNYNGHRIIGTDSAFLSLYELEVKEGTVWHKNFEVLIGSEVARKNKLKIGDHIHSAHGLAENGHQHDEHPFTVVGILAPSGSVVDNLILCNLESVWDVHGISHDHHDEDDHDHHHDEAHELAHEEEGHDHNHEHHDHDHAHADDSDTKITSPAEQVHGHEFLHGQDQDPTLDTTESYVKNIGQDIYKPQGLEITALLIQYASPAAISTLPRMINQSTAMQAASPAMETTRLFSLLGAGMDSLEILAYVIMIIAGLSVFISLYNALKERKYDLAVMRSLGAGKIKLFTLVIVEGLVITLIGGLLGILLGHLALWYISTMTSESADFIEAFTVNKKEFLIIVIAAVIGAIAAVIPAMKAYKTTISTILSER